MIEIASPLSQSPAGGQIDWHAYAARLSQYVIACVLDKDEDEVLRAAGAVLALSEGRLVTVTELVGHALAHRWNSMIYEAWAWEFRNRIYAHKRTMPALVWEALRTTASQSGDLNISAEQAYSAIREGQRELYDQ